MAEDLPRDGARGAAVEPALREHLIDPERCSFLRDHRVGGAMLLPTVLQLDLLASAVVRPGEAFRATDVRVLEPVVLAEAGPTRLTVTAADGASPGLHLQGAGGALHLAATVTPGPAPSAGGLAASGDGLAGEAARILGVDLPGTAALVYPPLFHGPAFQVLGAFGRDGDALVARLAPPVPGRALQPLPGSGGAVPVRVLEGLLQACGTWELAASGRMMRPSTIDEVSVAATDAGPAGEIRVRVEPRPAGDGERCFDGAAVDAAGRVLIAVRGYRAVRMPGDPLPDAARRLRDRLHPVPTAGLT